MEQPKVILVVVQRDRFSFTKLSLDSILADKSYPFQLIYIDGNSPFSIHEYLQEQANKHHFTLIRREQYLLSNEARNLALPLTQTADYVVFLDNDVIVNPGWLKQLVDCAQEEQAAIVSPLILQGDPLSLDIEIHVAGIEAKLSEQKNNKRWLQKKYLMAHEKYYNLSKKLNRRDVSEVEFHCILVRRALLEVVNLDNNFNHIFDYSDLCLQTIEIGEKIFFEPDSIVIFLNPLLVSGFDQDDIRFYRFKCSEKLVRNTIAYAQRKWNLAKDDDFMLMAWQWAIMYRQVPTKWIKSRGIIPKILLRICRNRWCPSQLRTPIEGLVLKLTFPPSGVSSNLKVAVNSPDAFFIPLHQSA